MGSDRRHAFRELHRLGVLQEEAALMDDYEDRLRWWEYVPFLVLVLIVIFAGTGE